MGGHQALQLPDTSPAGPGRAGREVVLESAPAGSPRVATGRARAIAPSPPSGSTSPRNMASGRGLITGPAPPRPTWRAAAPPGVDASPGRRRGCSRTRHRVTRPGRPALGAASTPSTARCSAPTSDGLPDHRSSISRSVRTSTPASRASRTSTSVVLPPQIQASTVSAHLDRPQDGHGQHRLEHTADAGRGERVSADVSAVPEPHGEAASMTPAETDTLIRQLISGDPHAAAAI